VIIVQISEAIEETWKLADSLLEEAAQSTLQRAGQEAPVDLTVVVADDAQLHELNLQFLGIDGPTDVLSFPGGETDPDSGDLYLGDVIVSLPRATAQAQAGGHSLQAELQLLVVHGVLHLCGYDHGDETEQARMWALQAEILQGLGCEISGPAGG
jgi:probable rRNA maturation factor